MARMAYCGPRGIPLSQFLAWSEADQQAALGWQVNESRRCNSCGTHPDDWDEKSGGDRNAFHAEPVQCPGCVQLERMREAPEIVKGQRGVSLKLARGPAGECSRCHPG